MTQFLCHPVDIPGPQISADGKRVPGAMELLSLCFSFPASFLEAQRDFGQVIIPKCISKVGIFDQC